MCMKVIVYVKLLTQYKDKNYITKNFICMKINLTSNVNIILILI